MNNKGNILVVDDTHETLALLTKLLTDEGYSVFSADSGELALKSIEKLIPDLILLDVRMKGIGGFEVCNRIKTKKNLIDIPLIFLTAATDKNDRIKGLQLGAVDYIVKPFEKEELIARIKTHFELYSYNKLFKEQTAEQLIEKEKLLSKQNEELTILNYELEQSNHEIKNLNEEYEAINEELRQTNQQLTEAKEKAEESNRLKTAFLQNMSHEIRTPMNAIVGFSNILDRTDLSPEKRKSFTTIIINSSNQLLSIVTDILTISSIETSQEKINIEKVCINNIIVEMLSIFKNQANNQNISIYAKQHLTNKQSEIYTDKTKITQILSNLISNSLKFTHEGFVEFGYILKDNFLEFYVKDSGIGIKPEMQEKIFERFRQAEIGTRRHYGGTGLGLSISKGFIELLGGKIWVKSEINNGSIFYFTLPYKPVYEIDNSKANQKENATTVLVAEDEEYNFLFIEELLIDMHLKLIHAKNGKETVEICKSNPNINLILMDIKMPVMDGHSAAIQIKEFLPDLPIIAQSAYALQYEKEKYNGVAFDDYITKPIQEEDLKHKVMKYLDRLIIK
ncbi:MAG: hypothetical protein A2046_10070 [Bacteroidetes bacterium GWA2_30_7]|nr:MAG: hypothetical protein A2046_10070 [Bacteroidetes bacterium GWA2_30_7]